jgi:hypothetical protein
VTGDGYTVTQVKPTRIDPAATRKAMRDAEEERTRRAYLEQPDAEAEADDWSCAEEWKS